MRILLQDCETRRYLAPGGAWNESVEAALEFEDLAKARDYGTAHGLSAVRVVALAGRGGAGAGPRGANFQSGVSQTSQSAEASAR